MATEKEFKLIGSFQDNITAKLKKLNREINTINKSFQKMQSKLRPIARDMGTIAMASERVTKALKNQRTGYQSNINSMRSYRTEMGKTVAAAKKLSQIKPPRPMPMPRGGGGRVPATAPSRGGGGGGGLGFLGTTGAVALGNILTQSIISGFQSGVALMMKPLQYFGNAFSERIGDEMADIQSAGGLFATDKKTGTGLFAGFEDALAMQERLNQSLAKSAAALPGATNDYVRTARQITDTVSIAFSKNQESFKKLAVSLGAAESATAEQQITKVLSTFTEKGVLLGQGQSGGIPLPILLEQLVSKGQVNVQGLKTRYQALRDNPLLASALEDAQDAINKTGAGTAERIGEVIKALDSALPVEVINKMRGSISGLQESFRSAFLDPDTGLFGLSRTLKVTTPKVDEFGRYLDKNGKVTEDVTQAVQEATSLFKIMRETIAYFLVPLAELTDALPGLFEPFGGIAEAFKSLRDRGRELSLNFNSYANWFDDTAQAMAKSVASLDEKDPKRIEKMAEATVLQNSKRQRASLAAFNDMLYDTGAITKESYNSTVRQLKDFGTKVDELTGETVPTVNLSRLSGNILKGIFNSPMMQEIGSTVGEALGAAVDAIFTLLDKLISGVQGDTGIKVVDSFVKGFQKVITPARFDQIMKIFERAMSMAFETIGSILVKVGIPALISAIKGALGGLAKSGPLGLAVVIGIAVKAVMMFNGALAKATNSLNQIRATDFGGGARGAAARGGAAGGRVQRFGKGGSLERLARMRRAKTPLGQVSNKVTSQFTKSIQGFTKNFGKTGKLGRLVPGGALAMGAVDMGLAMASGDSFGKAAAGTIGSVLGGAAGSFFGPAGTMIGGMAGGVLGDMVYDQFSPTAKIQREAAEMQLAAATKKTATESLTGRHGVGEAEYLYGDIAEFTKRLKYAGYANDENAKGLLKEYSERNVALENLKQLTAEYDKQKAILEPLKLPPQEMATRLKEVNDKIALAKTAYEKEQRELVTKFAETPKKIENAIVNTINQNLTLTQMDAAIASKIRGLNYIEQQKRRKKDKNNSTPETEESFMGRVSPLTKAMGASNGLVGALAQEMRYKPNGSKLVVANSSETILNTGQTALLANALKGSGSSPTINVTVNATGDGNDIANQVAAAVLNAVRQAENSTIS